MRDAAAAEEQQQVAAATGKKSVTISQFCRCSFYVTITSRVSDIIIKILHLVRNARAREMSEL